MQSSSPMQPGPGPAGCGGLRVPAPPFPAVGARGVALRRTVRQRFFSGGLAGEPSFPASQIPACAGMTVEGTGMTAAVKPSNWERYPHRRAHCIASYGVLPRASQLSAGAPRGFDTRIGIVNLPGFTGYAKPH